MNETLTGEKIKKQSSEHLENVKTKSKPTIGSQGDAINRVSAANNSLDTGSNDISHLWQSRSIIDKWLMTSRTLLTRAPGNSVVDAERFLPATDTSKITVHQVLRSVLQPHLH